MNVYFDSSYLTLKYLKDTKVNKQPSNYDW